MLSRVFCVLLEKIEPDFFSGHCNFASGVVMRSNLIQSATRGVNLLQVYTNYEIGRRIFEQECKSRGISQRTPQ
jgi:hypothetical protein